MQGPGRVLARVEGRGAPRLSQKGAYHFLQIAQKSA
jgi:hypothetical protein